MLAQWIAIALTVAGLTLGLWKQSTSRAAQEARMDEKLSFMKGEIIMLQNESQSPAERKALSDAVEAQILAHADMDAFQFGALNHAVNSMDAKLDKILNRLSAKA